MIDSTTSCEVRVPTYKRPDLLERALNSLIAQSHEDWYALVFDDSPDREAEKVINSLCDERLIYKPHPENVGRSKNIDHCFQSKAYMHGLYAFVLEDDNYLFPSFIEKNIEAIESHNINILLRNQEIRVEKDGKSVPTGSTTRERWFKRGRYTPLEVYSRVFFCEGISNGGLFWHTKRISSDLQVGTQIEHSWHQELFRTLQIKEPIWFEDKPLCVFTEFEFKPKLINFAPKHNRGTQSILIYLVKKYKHEIVLEAKRTAFENNEEALLEKKLLNALYIDYPFNQTSKLAASRIYLKALIRYLFYHDPFKQILTV